MKKILIGFLGLMMLVGVVGGTAYALFSSTVTVNNVAISAGNATLEFSPDNTNWYSDYTFSQWMAQNVYPGWSDCVNFWVRNVSSSDIKLDVSAQLMSATGNWDAFKDLLVVDIQQDGNPGISRTPANWNAAKISLNFSLNKPGLSGATKKVNICLTVPTTADNTIADQWLSTNWKLYGDQQP